MSNDFQDLKQLIDDAKHIVVLQADNPDGDSLASALALEAILSEQDKTVSLVCGVEMPTHLHYLEGWSRVQKEAPKTFDLSILVDASSFGLLETLERSSQMQWIKTKPLVIIDHHGTSEGIDFAKLTINQPAVATGELIYDIAQQLNWSLPLDGCKMLAVSILSDSLGFSSEATTARSLRTVADLVDKGVSLAELDNARRELQKREPELLAYKGKLLQRIEISDDGTIASIDIPWEEIAKYSHLYNPSMLVLDDMRLTTDVKVAIAFKVYQDGRITGKVRCSHGTNIADKLAANFGGGGHPYASGFKITDGRKLEDVKREVFNKVKGLLETDK